MNTVTKKESKDAASKKDVKGAKAKGKAAAKAETKTKKAVEKATSKGKSGSRFRSRQLTSGTV